MTLGSGAYHSEQNGSEDDPLRFIQIWIMPRERGLAPGVEQKEFSRDDRTNRLLRAIGPDRGGGSVLVHQDAAMYISRLDAGASVDHAFRPGFGGYLYLIDGSLEINGVALSTGDAAMIAEEASATIAANEASELIMVEVQVA
jgi:redox-sensitive bicupin YhaK (pirin superfamily)